MKKVGGIYMALGIIFLIATITVWGEERISTSFGPTGYVSVLNDADDSTAPTREVPTMNLINNQRVTRLLTLGDLTDGSAETTSYADETPAGEWEELSGATNWVDTGTVGDCTPDACPYTAPLYYPTDATDTSIYKKGTASLKLTWQGLIKEGSGSFRTITSDDLEADESIGFWIRSTIPLNAGDLILALLDDEATNSWRSFNIPAVSTANTWTWVEVDISSLTGGNGDAITGVAIYVSGAGATRLTPLITTEGLITWFDGIWKWDAANETTLGVAIPEDGLKSVVVVPIAAATDNQFTTLTEDTNYFVHYQTGNDAIVPITDLSASNALGLVVY